MQSSNRILMAAMAIGLVLAGPANALEPLKSYDKFTAAPINGARWDNAERSVQIKGGVLNVSLRAYGRTVANSDYIGDGLNMRFSNPAVITEISAKVGINGLEVNGCAANPYLSESRARIVASLFNTGTPTPGSSTGDVWAELRAYRYSNSTDPAGVVRLSGNLVYCTNSNCLAFNGSPLISLGTINIGQSATLETQWDKTNKQVLWTRDNGAFSGVSTYTASDANPPGFDYKALDARLDVANCVGAAPLTGFIGATFDNVMVNKSAAP